MPQDDRKHIIEIVEDEMAHYKKIVDKTNEEEIPGLEMRQRGRLADKLARENGFTGYSCISYVELEYAIDENEQFNHLI